MEKPECPNCKSIHLIYNQSMGETVCDKCKTVVDESMIDCTPEWRAYGPEQGNKVRTGAALTPLRHDIGMGTQIGRGKGEIFKVSPRKRAQFVRMKTAQNRQISSRGRNLRFALSEVQRFGGMLSLSKALQEKVSILYRKAMDGGLVRGRSTEALVAALIYVSCRESGAPRTLEEVAKVTCVNKKELGKSYRFVCRKLGIKISPARPQDYVPRFGSMMELPEKTQIKAVNIIDRASSKDTLSGKGPTGVAAAALYIASALMDVKKTQKQIADRVGVTEVTVRNRCREITEALGIQKELGEAKG